MPAIYLDNVTGFFLKADKAQALSTTAAMIAVIALSDWAIGARASLGLLYILPMMMGATVLSPWQTAALALGCSALRSQFDLPSPPLETVLRFAFAFLAYTLSGLFVTALIRTRELVVDHLNRIRREQDLRHELEEQLEILVESSPAAIFTADRGGVVLAANHAANALLAIPDGQSLQGRKIGDFIPLLTDALKVQGGLEGFRTAAQCQGRRADGNIFLAHTWFSSYVTPQGPRLAAIVVDSSEEMRDREEHGLQQLMKANRIAAAAVSHEVRNLCSAISVVCSNLGKKPPIAQDVDFRGLATLVGGLEQIASSELQGRVQDSVEAVALREVLDDLRIVIEPDWHEIDGAVVWQVPPELPSVLAERHGLLQAFLNLAKNGHRAVQNGAQRELLVSVSQDENKVVVRFRDTGPGIADTSRLFEPFQPGSYGTGLGLYVSRAMLRSYGGDLKFEPQAAGSCFRVEVKIA